MQRFVARPLHDAASVNSTYACENNATLNGLLKNELAFQGCKLCKPIQSHECLLKGKHLDVMSDWYATHSTANAANNGLDVSRYGLLLAWFRLIIVSHALYTR